jgi:hypothetical protein
MVFTATFNNISYNGKVMRSKSSILTFVLLLYFNMLRRNDSTKLNVLVLGMNEAGKDG